MFFKLRVTLLLMVLAAVLLYAWHDVSSRNARHDWTRPLDVAIVILRQGPVDEAGTRGLHDRATDLGDRLAAEMHRYRPSGPRPFVFHVYGPVDVTAGPPAPQGEGFLDLAKHAWSLHGYLSDIDDRASVPSAGFDSRIYVTVRKPLVATRQMIEGASEQGGRVGTVAVELDAGMVDFALFVVAHELFHTLGATDKYDANGRALVPDGLAEPDRSPRFPQRFAELMARNRPISATEEAVPDKIDDLAVGSATAREIGW